jgi:DNA-binding Lrp family transcriptional regulator
MPRSGDIDETDMRIVELIRECRDTTGKGPTYKDIGDTLGLFPSEVHYRVKSKLVPAGLVQRDRYERGSLEAVETQE